MADVETVLESNSELETATSGIHCVRFPARQACRILRVNQPENEEIRNGFSGRTARTKNVGAKSLVSTGFSFQKTAGASNRSLR